MTDTTTTERPGVIDARPVRHPGRWVALAVIAVLVAMGGLEPQLRGHTRGALNVGCTPTEIVETVIHTVQYVGFPRALNAIRVVTDTLIENGAVVPDALGPQG